MGLVDYGSDSDSDSGSPPPSIKPSTTPADPSSASTSLLNLPPPKSSLSLPAPKANAPKPPATAAQPPKKARDKGPVRILLDLPPPSASAAASGSSDGSDEPAKKRPKLSLGSGNGGGLTGLAAMLPKPKNEAKAAPPPPKPASARPAASLAGLDELFSGTEGADGAIGSNGSSAGPPSGLFVPPSVVAKGKDKAPAANSARPASSEIPAEPAVDFFGIGSVASPAAPPSSSSSSASKPSLPISSAPSLSAAPSVSSAPNPKSGSSAPSFGTPTASDPYPGFTQLPSGEWVAKDQQTYEMWMAWMAQQQQGVPEGLDAKDVEARGGMVDVNEEERRAREAWANRPGQVPPSKVGGGDEKTSAQLKGVPKQIGGMARRKGQLSSLLAAAHDNRAELEERIAQARANRKGAGSKYGF
ncbi:mitotic checkpoint protein PRCC, C-terminal domain protein [Rhodotorula toruloides]|uniref:Mitotic checkpoint protein PRCC, C-terminal domain protein n=1 Tax=Rhodotorula toruloides TaxID=5286 RepID=A0A511KBR6_RHOTO|nr:mitotic checkpoint protein PRCC, C-terminal domain protein [Rhodotorula toruloides]